MPESRHSTRANRAPPDGATFLGGALLLCAVLAHRAITFDPAWAAQVKQCVDAGCDICFDAQ